MVIVFSPYTDFNFIKVIKRFVMLSFIVADFNFAIKKGFNAICLDLKKAKVFPIVDTFIIVGSLYHFHEMLDEFLLIIMKMQTNI